MYPCVCSSVAGFIQQLSVSYVSNGYVFYVTGVVPEAKDPARVDAKLIDLYGIDISKWSRARRKKAGIANVQYLRLDRLFVILATHGAHEFFEHEGDRVRDLRRVPLKAFGYAVTQKKGHAHVRIEREEFKRLQAYFLNRALHRRGEEIGRELTSLRFEPYAPVRRQLLQLVRCLNGVRRLRGFDAIPFDVLRGRRRIVRPFGQSPSDSTALVGGRWGEFERGGGASSFPSHQPDFSP